MSDQPATRRLIAFGGFRTGSNFLRALIELNYDATVATRLGGYKHLPVPKAVHVIVWQRSAGCGFLILTGPLAV